MSARTTGVEGSRETVAPYICPPDHKHDKTSTCRNQHKCHCEPCVVAKREYNYYRTNMRAAGHRAPGKVDSTGSRRRLQALAALGWSTGAIGSHLGVTGDFINLLQRSQTLVTTRTATRVSALYEKLSMKIPAAGTRRERQGVTRTKNDAKRNGWFPPLAWDDIDDINEHPPVTAERCHFGHLIQGKNATPAVGHTARRRGVLVCSVCSEQTMRAQSGEAMNIREREDKYRRLVPADNPDVDGVDVEVVHASLRGEVAELNYRERRALVRVAYSWRWSDRMMSQRTGMPEKSIQRLRAELNLPAWTAAEWIEREEAA